jgi:hypothetical protein
VKPGNIQAVEPPANIDSAIAHKLPPVRILFL